MGYRLSAEQHDNVYPRRFADHVATRDLDAASEGSRWSSRRSMAVILLLSIMGWAVIALVLVSIGQAWGQGFSFHVTGNQNQIVLRQSLGGNISKAQQFFQLMQSNGTSVRITGTCASACTLALSYQNTCWTPRTRFLFHRGTSPDGDHDRATLQMVEALPVQIIEHLPDWRSWPLEYRQDRVLTGREAANLLNDRSRLC